MRSGCDGARAIDVGLRYGMNYIEICRPDGINLARGYPLCTHPLTKQLVEAGGCSIRKAVGR